MGHHLGVRLLVLPVFDMYTHIIIVNIQMIIISLIIIKGAGQLVVKCKRQYQHYCHHLV